MVARVWKGVYISFLILIIVPFISTIAIYFNELFNLYVMIIFFFLAFFTFKFKNTKTYISKLYAEIDPPRGDAWLYLLN